MPFAGFHGYHHGASERDRHIASGLLTTAGVQANRTPGYQSVELKTAEGPGKRKGASAGEAPWCALRGTRA
jgi:hypothetical protein